MFCIFIASTDYTTVHFVCTVRHIRLQIHFLQASQQTVGSGQQCTLKTNFWEVTTPKTLVSRLVTEATSWATIWGSFWRMLNKQLIAFTRSGRSAERRQQPRRP